MGAIFSVWTMLVKIGLAVAFVGLGVLGLALLGLAVTFDGALLHRLAVVILGLGGIAIAAGYVQTAIAPG